jgi:hypothetical protein
MVNKRPDKRLLLAIGATHLFITTLTWRDLNRRPAELVRGRKLFWRVAAGVNTLGSVAYLLIGRRSSRALPHTSE